MSVDFDKQAQLVLFEAIRALFPLGANPSEIIKRHSWRDRRYVGEMNARVVSWNGWSANLSTIDPRYRTLYIDSVPNVFSMDERTTLFGYHFAESVEKFDNFVVQFVLDFPPEAHQIILNEGFIPRPLTRSVHACIISDIRDFTSVSSHHWALQLVRLANLQVNLA